MAPPWTPGAEFDLDGLRTQLDGQAMALAEAQEASLRSRKELAGNTKGMGVGRPNCTAETLCWSEKSTGRSCRVRTDSGIYFHQRVRHQAPCQTQFSAELRKKLPPEVSKEVGPLLRAYQEEIDRLTNRCDETFTSTPHFLVPETAKHALKPGLSSIKALYSLTTPPNAAGPRLANPLSSSCTSACMMLPTPLPRSRLEW